MAQHGPLDPWKHLEWIEEQSEREPVLCPDCGHEYTEDHECKPGPMNVAPIPDNVPESGSDAGPTNVACPGE